MAGNANAWDTKILPNMEQITGWARDGYTIKQIAETLGIGVSTFLKYKAERVELREALKINREMADLTVENSLFKRANGYTYVKTRIEEETDANGKVIKRKTTKEINTLPPDTTAQIFWLKNRQPAKWRDVWKLEHGGTVASNVKIDKGEFKELMKEVMADDDC